MQRYLTIKAAAEALSVSQDTIRRILPKLGATNVVGGSGNRLIRIPETALEAYLASNTITPPATATKAPAQGWNIERRR